MAVANLAESMYSTKLRIAELQQQIAERTMQKNLAIYSQGDLNAQLNTEKGYVRDYYKTLFEKDEGLQGLYTDYTEMPEFEDEIAKITAKFQDMIAELTAWETFINGEITTLSTELEEEKAFKASLEQMLTTTIQEDFSYGLE